MSNSLDPDQAQCSVSPDDISPNCLQWLSAEDTIVGQCPPPPPPPGSAHAREVSSLLVFAAFSKTKKSNAEIDWLQSYKQS